MSRLLAVLLAVGLLAGTALAAVGDPIERHTPADMAKARSVLIKRTDLGVGWRLDTSPDTDADVNCSYYHPDESDLVETGAADRSFESDGGLVASEAAVYKTVAQAETSWRRGAKPALARCFAEELREEIVKDGIAVRIVRAGSLAFPKLAPRTMAWRIVLELTSQGRTVPVVVDLVAMARGRVLAALALLQAGGPPAAAEERRLAGLIARRMR